MSKNRLANETSLYLLQHAENPVDWYPWGDEAIKKARELDKPILLSIGYSACHWCHVMAHESFEDPATAKLMNELFINIKVDREERPDLDKIYLMAHHLLLGRPGGWPLTIFLVPTTLQPFYCGTYFPKKTSFGIQSFTQALQMIAKYYREYHAQVEDLTTKLTAAFTALESTTIDKNVSLNLQPLSLAQEQLSTYYDNINGGFGGAPKFPHPTNINFLIREKQPTALAMANHSLTKMAQGGLFDQIGGGFYRYTVDEEWIIPHFEKMLYDNGQLLALYAQASVLTKNDLFKKIVIETAEWTMREMQDRQGGYYASISADSEGEEGKFYYWDINEIEKILSNEEYQLIKDYFDLSPPANFEDHWHLRIADTSIAFNNQLVKSAISKLFTYREKRIKPATDTKIITAWNALMIKGMTIAGWKLQENNLLNSAEQALDFLLNNLWRQGRLLSTFKDGKARFNAYLDDHVFLLEAILYFLQVRWNNKYLQCAIDLADLLCNQFLDKENGGFYYTSHDHETLIYRPKPIIDEAIPAANGIAAYCLTILGNLLGKQNYLDAAEITLKAYWNALIIRPNYYLSLLLGLEEFLNPSTMVIVRGETNNLKDYQQLIANYYHPKLWFFALPTTEEKLPLALDKPIPKSGVTAYVCCGKECYPPLTNKAEFEELLEREKDTGKRIELKE